MDAVSSHEIATRPQTQIPQSRNLGESAVFSIRSECRPSPQSTMVMPSKALSVARAAALPYTCSRRKRPIRPHRAMPHLSLNSQASTPQQLPSKARQGLHHSGRAPAAVLAEASVRTVTITLLHELYQHLLNACIPLFWIPYEVGLSGVAHQGPELKSQPGLATPGHELTLGDRVPLALAVPEHHEERCRIG